MRSVHTRSGLVIAAALLAACASSPETGDTNVPGVEPPAPSAKPPTNAEAPRASTPTLPPDGDPDANADPNAPSPTPDPTLPPSTREQLFKAFAPRFHLHPDDVHRPANVDWFLARSTLRYSHTACSDHEVLGLGQVSQASLITQKHEDNGLFCRHDGGDLRSVTSSENFFLQVADPAASYAGAPRSEWKTYAVWRPAEGDLVDLEYWVFYPYNDGFSIFNHEADWEHVRARIDPRASGGAGKLIEVKFSQHHGGTTLKPGDPKLSLDGTHPIAYVAKGTHANYQQPGVYDIAIGNIANDTAAAAPAADVWKTEDTLVLIGTREAPLNGQTFVKYWGRWGKLGPLPETNGITRHFP